MNSHCRTARVGPWIRTITCARRAFSPVFFMVAMLLPLAVQAGNSLSAINSVEIAARTLSAAPHCLHYQIKGVCFWQFKGVITKTNYLIHYLPDVVVSVFNKSNENPWLEMRDTLDVAGSAAQSAIVSGLTEDKVGSGQHKFNNPLVENTFFKEVDIVGNPALATFSNYAQFLPSAASIGMPYFQSMLDSALWRGFSPQADPEQLYAASVALVRYIGMGGGSVTWGTAVPFEGKIETSNDAKAAAVVAQRASNLMTTTNASSFGHVYQPLGTTCGTQCKAATIKENDDDTQFQMIFPVAETTCERFGQHVSYGEEAETKTQGAYAWVLWRKYEGCVQGAGTFVGKVLF